jgi:hypothetical protein
MARGVLRTAARLEATAYPFAVEEVVVDGKAAAERAGYDLASFDAFVVWHPPLSGWAAGTGAPFGVEIGGAGYPLLLVHELGHSLFAFPHAGVAGDPTGDHYATRPCVCRAGSTCRPARRPSSTRPRPACSCASTASGSAAPPCST